MADRRADLLSLVTGLLAVTFAGLALLDLSGAVAVDARVCTALALVAVGLTALVRAVVTLRRRGGSGATGS